MHALRQPIDHLDQVYGSASSYSPNGSASSYSPNGSATSYSPNPLASFKEASRTTKMTCSGDNWLHRKLQNEYPMLARMNQQYFRGGGFSSCFRTNEYTQWGHIRARSYLLRFSKCCFVVVGNDSTDNDRCNKQTVESISAIQEQL